MQRRLNVTLEEKKRKKIKCAHTHTRVRTQTRTAVRQDWIRHPEMYFA